MGRFIISRGQKTRQVLPTPGGFVLKIQVSFEQVHEYYNSGIPICQVYGHCSKNSRRFLKCSKNGGGHFSVMIQLRQAVICRESMPCAISGRYRCRCLYSCLPRCAGRHITREYSLILLSQQRVLPLLRRSDGGAVCNSPGKKL